MRKIVLIGYMGSGKSTIAKLLAKDIKVSAFDLDDIIEEDTNLSIATLFSDKGEVYFRKLETQTLSTFINNDKPYVLSLGGGTPCYGTNLEVIQSNENCVSIYLRASVNELYNRLLSEKAKRPLIADLSDANFKEFIAKHLFERNTYYSQSDYTVSVDAKTPEEIVKEIKELLV